MTQVLGALSSGNGNVFVFVLDLTNRRQNVTNVSMISYKFKTHFENYECLMPQQPRRSKTIALRAFCFCGCLNPQQHSVSKPLDCARFLEGSDYLLGNFTTNLEYPQLPGPNPSKTKSGFFENQLWGAIRKAL